MKEAKIIIFFYLEWLTFEHFAPKNPSNHPQTLLFSFSEPQLCFVFECAAGKFFYLSWEEKHFLFLSQAEGFPPIIEVEGFSCFVALTGL